MMQGASMTEGLPYPPSGSKARLSAAEIQELHAANQKVMATFGEIVGVLMRSSTHKTLPLSDLERIVLPAIMTTQFRVATAELTDLYGLNVPVSVAFWAHVSPAVATKLQAQADQKKPHRLEPQDWKSGDIPWLLDIVGPPEAQRRLLSQLRDTVFKGKVVKGFGASPA
jgi:cytolysin-activating lysine-acyltransferase